MRRWPCLVLTLLLPGCGNLAWLSPVPPPVAWSEGHWRVAVARPGVGLRGLAVVDRNVVWVGGNRGTLLRSVDAGRTWRDVAPPGTAACDFRDLHAFDRDTAVAMVAGQPARVYRTTDGGRSWTVVHEDRRGDAFFDAIAFDGDTGYLLGDPLDGAFTVLRSDDRGGSWHALPGPRAAAGEAAFAASGTCIDAVAGVVRFVSGGSRCRVFTSRDGGAAWSAMDLPMPSGQASQGAFGIGVSGCDLVVVGGDHAAPAASDGTAARSFDGGDTYWPVAAPAARGYRSAVVCLDAMQRLAVGEGGASYSADRGRSWRVFGDQGFHAIARARDGAVFACGAGGRVAELMPRR